MLAGSPTGLSYWMDVRSALNLIYVAATQYASDEERAVFDAWMTCTVEEAAQWTQEQHKQQWELIASIGEVFT